MKEPLLPWWNEVDNAARLLASQLNSAVARAARDGMYTAPSGSPPPTRRRQPASLRHLAEVIRTNRLAPGMSIDKDDISAVLAGKPRSIANPVLVVAVARAAHLIAGKPLDDDEAARLEVACAHVSALIDAAEQADERAPRTVPVLHPSAQNHRADDPSTVGPAHPIAEPVILDGYFTTRRPRRRRALIAVGLSALLIAGTSTTLMLRDRGTQRAAPATPDAVCGLGATGYDIIQNTTELFKDDEATRLSPTLDFDQMNGSARYARYQYRTYYWGRAGSDDHDPRSGGARIRWSTPDGPWRSCETALPQSERGYVHTPAVATTIGEKPVTVQICLWRDTPRRENCTTISNGQ